jgi:hypothetical protein
MKNMNRGELRKMGDCFSVPGRPPPLAPNHSFSAPRGQSGQSPFFAPSTNAAGRRSISVHSETYTDSSDGT